MAETFRIPQEAITAAARELAHFISGTEHDPYPEPDAEDIQWAIAALEAAARTMATASVFGTAGTLWYPPHGEPVGVPDDDDDPVLVAGALERIASRSHLPLDSLTREMRRLLHG